MFAKIFVAFLAVASLVAAHPTVAPADNQCSSGTLHCCDQVASSPSDNSASLGGLIPINLQGLGVPLGLNCNPISVIGAGSSGSCSTTTACCDHTDSSSAVGVDCTPVSDNV